METVFSYLGSGLAAVVPFVILLGILIFVHELGHFLVARWCGVRVETFSLGFGKKLFQVKRGDTNYCISLIPLGGYVKMFGDETGGSIPEDQKKYSFSHKTVGQRIAVVAAGPLMNFLFAVFIFSLVAFVGEEVRSPKVGDIAASSVAYSSGFRSGDQVLSVSGESVATWDDFQMVLNQSKGKEVSIQVKRESSDQLADLKVTPSIADNPNILSLQRKVAEVAGLSPNAQAANLGVQSGSVAAKFGFQTGDRVLQVNDRKISYFRELENALLPFQGQEVRVSVERRTSTASSEVETVQLNGKLPSFSSLAGLGIEKPDLYLYAVVPKSPAEAGGLKPGDRIVSIGMTQPREWLDVLTTVKSFDGDKPLLFTVDRNGQSIEIPISPQITSQMTPQGVEERRYTVGISPWYVSAAPALVTVSYRNPIQFIARGFDRTVDVSVMTVVSILRLVQAEISPKNVGGVISIGMVAAETFRVGLLYFLQMMGVISVTLFVFNLLPIPILDGGHLLFYTIEAIKGAPLSMRKMEIAQQFGLVLIVSLMIFAFYNDINRVLGLW